MSSIFSPIAFGLRKVSENKVVFYNTHLNIHARLLDCGNKKMNKGMQETLDGDKYPYIVEELKEMNSALNEIGGSG